MHWIGETETASSHLLCLFGRSPLHTNCAFVFIYPTQMFTLFSFFSWFALLHPAEQSQLGPGHCRHGYLQAPQGYRWHFSACPDPMLGTASGKKGRGIWLPTVAEGTSEHDGIASKLDQGHAAKCSAVLTALEQSIEISEVAGLGFVWGFLFVCLHFLFVFSFNFFTAELYQVTQAKCGKAWKPQRHYLFIFTNPAVSQFNCFQVVLWFWIFFSRFFFFLLLSSWESFGSKPQRSLGKMVGKNHVILSFTWQAKFSHLLLVFCWPIESQSGKAGRAILDSPVN